MRNLVYKITTKPTSFNTTYREIFLDLEYLKPRLYEHTSRYKNLRRIVDSKTNKIYHETWVQKGVDQSSEDFYITITQENEGRLDIIAAKYLNTAKYWWVIALANNIIDPFDIPIGTRLRIPQLVSLYNTGGVLSGN